MGESISCLLKEENERLEGLQLELQVEQNRLGSRLKLERELAEERMNAVFISSFGD